VIPIAHALLIGRRDLPIPEWLFAWAAAVVLVAWFFALSLLWTRTRFEEESWRAVNGRASGLLVNRATEIVWPA
jgi:arginine exporter protein ArgO